MKKLKLNLKEGMQILTREQLKQVTGGLGSGSGSGSGSGNKYCLCGSSAECLVMVSSTNTQNCTEICADAVESGYCE